MDKIINRTQALDNSDQIRQIKLMSNDLFDVLDQQISDHKESKSYLGSIPSRYGNRTTF